ncbi:maleylpyruvate isomerase family mycothiol-dependent enzyme [Arthrobacter sp. FW306-04-A]|uniref:maleylpyruvate isomerase family mycothiol-dependent enzyme n=1 Tax=Arthrobacter sp. FW306-04-A TaxID=2879619 RepID=UPI0037BE3B3A|nr:maleylpyruvate isomerase family mycothiol-dependent enzyme [Arthrobacter sp. FW306-04-A]
MSPDLYLAELSICVDQLRILARQPEEKLAHLVPACPAWTLDGLFGHLGSIERWAAEIVLGGKFVEEPPAPSAGASEWFLEGTNSFLETMASIDPGKECWTFGPPPRESGFWLRRQAHEHAIHLVDARMASDMEAPAFSQDFMFDGIGEVLEMFTPRQLRLGRMPQPEAAVTFNVPGSGSWTIGTGSVAASITAPLRSMYLGLWGRSDLTDTAAIEGDASLALRVLQGPITP